MKKIIIFVVLFLASGLNSITAQNTYPYPSTGNLGIGTTSPLYALDVNGTVRLGGFTGNNANETSKLVWYKDTPNGWDEQLLKVSSSYGPWGRPGFAIHMHETKHFGFYSTNWNPLLDIEGGTGRVYIKGDVGIGTTTPTDKLSVNGTTRIINGNDLFLQASSSTRPDDPGDIVFVNGAGVEKSRIYSDPGGSGMFMFSIGNSSIPKMILTGNGNLGVGCPYNASERLSVNGTVLAKKVRVTQTSPDWPDYVFATSYKLRSLETVENFITLNHHLPDVPSAKEITTNGIDLGDNQAVLLRKVEELTLYILELNKRIEQLEKQNNPAVKK